MATGVRPDGARVQFDTRELLLLEAACRQADQNALLEALIVQQGLLVEGSTGQQRLNAALAEVRAGRLALQRLLAGVDWPDETDGQPVSAASTRARKAAEARWQRKAALDDRSGA